MTIVNLNCFEKTKVRWGIFKKLFPTKLHSEQSARLQLTSRRFERAHRSVRIVSVMALSANLMLVAEWFISSEYIIKTNKKFNLKK